MFLLGVCTDFVLGFFPRQVLGFSALSSASSWIFSAKLPEDLPKNNENQVKSGGVWGGVAPPARAAENMPIVSQEARKSSTNLQERPITCPGAGGLGGRSPPSKSSRKHAQSKPRSFRNSSKNFRKWSPDPPKIDAKTLLDDVLKEDRIKNALGEGACQILGPIFLNFEPS